MKTPASSLPQVLFCVAALVLLPVSLARAQFSKTLVAKGSTWKYAPNYNSLDATAWKTDPNFDAAWPSGPGPLGYGDPTFTATDLSTPPVPRPITLYLRHTFTLAVADRSQIQGMYLGMLRDDGVVIYLNGIEIARSNMPDGAIVNTTGATGAVGGADEQTYYDGIVGPTVTMNALQSGTNILAVEVHQDNTGSSDTQFDMELIGAEVPVDYGTVQPNRGVNFEDAEYYGIVVTDFTRILSSHTDYNWNCTPLNFPSVAGGDYQVEAAGDLFDLSSWEWVAGGGNSTWTSEHIDTRNYKDVKITFGIRAQTTTGAFEAGDSIKAGAKTSNDGVAFPDEVLAANFVGGGVSSGQVTMITSTTPKKARIPNSNAENTANPNWRQAGFNDATWLSGTNGVGYERSPGDAVNYTSLVGVNVGAMYNVNQTCYVRVRFTAPSPATLQSLSLSMKYDDGFVAYLNGTEVARANAPGSVGTPPAFNAGATAAHDDAASVIFQTFDLTAMKNLLVNGSNNVLAIHALNSGVGSSDLIILPELRGTEVGGGTPIFPPETLNDMRIAFVPDPGDPAYPLNFQGPFFFYEADIPDAVESLFLFIEARTNETSEFLFADQIRVTGTPLSVDSYDTWIQLESDLDRGELEGRPEGNPDGDPFANLIEYAVGGSAEFASMVSEVSGLPLAPQVEIVEDGSLEFIEMEFRMLNATVMGMLAQPTGGYTVRDLKYIPQISEDASEWDDGATGNTVAQLVGDFVDNNDGTLTVRVRFTQAISAATEQLFVRLAVQQVIQ